MAETNAIPTDDELLAYRSDLSTYLPAGKTLQNIMATALAEVKRFLEDDRNVLWSRVYDLTNDEYFSDPDDNERNKDRIQKAIMLFTVSILFHDYAVTHGGSWWELYLAYRSDAENTLRNAKLDIDIDDSGTVDESETAKQSQSFLVK
jgi:GAF domain-containing protein